MWIKWPKRYKIRHISVRDFFASHITIQLITLALIHIFHNFFASVPVIISADKYEAEFPLRHQIVHLYFCKFTYSTLIAES